MAKRGAELTMRLGIEEPPFARGQLRSLDRTPVKLTGLVSSYAHWTDSARLTGQDSSVTLDRKPMMVSIHGEAQASPSRLHEIIVETLLLIMPSDPCSPAHMGKHKPLVRAGSS